MNVAGDASTDRPVPLAAVSSYFMRLLRSLGAYQIADVVSKVIAVVLLPVYSRYIPTSGYAVVTILTNGGILVSIIVRFGIIEAFLRYYFVDEDRERREALARRAVRFLLITSTIVAVVVAAFAAPLARIVISDHDPTTFRIAVLGLWTFTNLELAYGLLRVDERLRAYATAALTNVALTIATSLILVVGFKLGARGLLIGNYGASTVVLLGLWWTMRKRLLPRRAGGERLRELLRFGLPTVPAEASAYGLSIADSLYIFHEQSKAAAGQYSTALKFAGVIAFIVRAFMYAFPPLAYSIKDDAEAGRLYGLVATYYALVSGWIVVGLTLESRWILRLLQSSYFGAYKAVPWVALGWSMYGFWVILLVVAGRAKVTTRNFPAAFAGLVANIVLLLVLVPRLGIAGGGIALAGAYVVMLGVMHVLVRRAFTVVFEWRRLAQIVLVMGGLAAAGDLALPTHGAVGFVTRAAVFLAVPLVMYFTGFAHEQELVQLRGLVRWARARVAEQRGAA
jgi:O-antigen/teichoic acid export membrane protein